MNKARYEYIQSKGYWKDKHGTIWHVEQMNDGHLQGAHRLLMQEAFQKVGKSFMKICLSPTKIDLWLVFVSHPFVLPLLEELNDRSYSAWFGLNYSQNAFREILALARNNKPEIPYEEPGFGDVVLPACYEIRSHPSDSVAQAIKFLEAKGYIVSPEPWAKR